MMQNIQPKTVGVTGASGFIGGAICIELKKRGYNVVGLDLVKRNHLIPYFDKFYQCDFVSLVTNNHKEWLEFDAIIHCAGTSLVGPSIDNPLDYYSNNVAKTIRLIEWMHLNRSETHLLFSSSASVYKTSYLALKESDTIDPISPYAKSKRIVETVLTDMAAAYGFKSTVFRYFNACGAMNEIHGQVPDSTHIFARLFESELFAKLFVMNGDDFPTHDGSCVRDYVHITDIADAHIKAIEHKATGIYNLGSFSGFSNLEIIKAVGVTSYAVTARRPGDGASLVADNSFAKAVLGWVPTYSLDDIVSSLRIWYNSDNYKELSLG